MDNRNKAKIICEGLQLVFPSYVGYEYENTEFNIINISLYTLENKRTVEKIIKFNFDNILDINKHHKKDSRGMNQYLLRFKDE
ncbi:MAG: hypothetical protein GY828_03585 [Candidatus Gracilibacteria bacterium]|nr:hypothetical protein [Candidatus Gracilibacteria bacterium]